MLFSRQFLKWSKTFDEIIVFERESLLLTPCKKKGNAFAPSLKYFEKYYRSAIHTAAAISIIQNFEIFIISRSIETGQIIRILFWYMAYIFT